MGADATVSALSNILKTKYNQKKLYMLAYTNNPLFGMVKKREDFGGNNKLIAIRTSTPNGRSAAFATAQSNKSTSTFKGFLLTRAFDYAVSGITTETILASKGDENALYDGLKAEMDGSVHTITRSLAISMYRNGGGARGQISAGSNVGTATITLSNVSDVTNFETGMVLQTSATDGTSGSARTGTVTITGIDRDAGTLTASGNWTAGVAAAAAGDFLFVQGDFGVMLKGLAAWLPTTAPTSGDSFFGVDRSSDTVRLAGIRYNGGGGPIEETLIDSAARAGREGANPDVCVMNNLDRANLIKALGTKAVYEKVESSDATVGYKALLIEGDKGPIKVMADVNCPKGTAYMLQLDTWALESLGAAPRFIDLDGNKMLRESSADGFEWRIGFYGNISCEAPGYNVVITL